MTDKHSPVDRDGVVSDMALSCTSSTHTADLHTTNANHISVLAFLLTSNVQQKQCPIDE